VKLERPRGNAAGILGNGARDRVERRRAIARHRRCLGDAHPERRGHRAFFAAGELHARELGRCLGVAARLGRTQAGKRRGGVVGELLRDAIEEGRGAIGLAELAVHLGRAKQRVADVGRGALSFRDPSHFVVRCALGRSLEQVRDGLERARREVRSFGLSSHLH
jgi:hypothetical protein